MTVRDLLAEMYDDLNHGNQTPGAEVQARYLRLLNTAHRTILREPGVSALRGTLNPLTLASEADRAIYGLPASLLRVTSITERDSDRRLIEVSIDWIRAHDPGLTATGTPDRYAPLGHRVIQEAPASTGLWVASSSSSDTTQAIHVAGIRSGGLAAPETSASLNGTTRVAIGSLTDYVDVTTIALQQSCVGVVSIYDAASGGNTIAEIGVGAMSPRYFCLQFYPVPTAAVTYYIDGEVPLPKLDGMNDVPLLPEEFHDLVSTKARMLEHENKGDALRFQMAQRHYDAGMSRLKHFVSSNPDSSVVIGSGRAAGYSRMGPFFPAEYWN